MSKRSTRERKARWRFVEEDGREEMGVSPSQPQDSSDEGPSTSTSGGIGWRRSQIRGRRGADAAGDSSHSRSPLRQEAWKTEADPDVANPHPLKFSPKRSPGVQPPLTNGSNSPKDVFDLFFDAELLRFLCANTNKNVVKNLGKDTKFAWTDITPEELKKYLGMLLFMSVCNLPKMSDFWRVKTIFHVPCPASVMSRERFRIITSNLHTSDPEEDILNDQKKGTEDYDPLQKVRSLMDKISNRCKSIYHPKQHISVNEKMVATKAGLAMKPNKANLTKWGMKLFVLKDMNGYTVNFKLYMGKKQGVSGEDLSFDTVAQLVNKDYLGSGYIVYCDSFYTSPLLFHYLSQQGFGACGTYRQGRAGVPTAQENSLDRKSKTGSIRWIRDGDLLFVKWMDTREVSIATTVHPVYTGETVLRWQKTEDGHSYRVPVPRPTAVGEYHKYMVGVHTSDQMLGADSVHRKIRKWPLRVFQHLLDIAVTNSFIVHKELSTLQDQKPMTPQAFQEELCAKLLGVAGPPKPTTQGHFPVPTNKREDTCKRQKASMGRKQCTLCKRSTPWMCEDCKVGLCLQLDRNCFTTYHCS